MMKFALCDKPPGLSTSWPHALNYELDVHRHEHLNQLSGLQERITELLALCLK